jgi:hypothetical protein
MTLGNAAAAKVRFIIQCLGCAHRGEPEPTEVAQRG